MDREPDFRRDADRPVPVGDSDRAAAAAHLEQAVGHGQLDLTEYISRLDQTNQAQTDAELAALTSDLVPIVGSRPVSAPRSIALFDNVVRAGNWQLPAESKAMAVFADVELDLRQATLTGTEVHIGAICVFGDVRITVPEGVDVVLEADSVLSNSHTCALAAVPRIPGTPLIRVHPTGWLGTVHIESRAADELRLSTRLREGWRRWRANRKH